jgi:hypothetical protein
LGTQCTQPLVITQTSGQDVNHDVLGPRHARAELPYGEVWSDLTSQVKSRRQSLCRPLGRDDLTYLVGHGPPSRATSSFRGNAPLHISGTGPAGAFLADPAGMYAAQARTAVRVSPNHHRNIAGCLYKDHQLHALRTEHGR